MAPKKRQGSIQPQRRGKAPSERKALGGVKAYATYVRHHLRPRAAMAHNGSPITTDFLPPCDKVPQHFLFALSAPDQTPILQHEVQDARDGVVSGVDILSQLAGLGSESLYWTSFGVHFSVTLLQQAVTWDTLQEVLPTIGPWKVIIKWRRIILSFFVPASIHLSGTPPFQPV